MKAFKTNAKAELQDIIDEFVEDVCERAEVLRERESITDESSLYCFTEDLKQLSELVEKATMCKSVKACQQLRKKFERNE